MDIEANYEGACLSVVCFNIIFIYIPFSIFFFFLFHQTTHQPFYFHFLFFSGKRSVKDHIASVCLTASKTLYNLLAARSFVMNTIAVDQYQFRVFII